MALGTEAFEYWKPIRRDLSIHVVRTAIAQSRLFCIAYALVTTQACLDASCVYLHLALSRYLTTPRIFSRIYL